MGIGALASTVAFLILAIVVGLGWSARLDASIYFQMLLGEGTFGSNFAQAVTQTSGVAIAIAAAAAGLVLAAVRRSPAWLLLLAPIATIPIEVLAKNLIPQSMGDHITDFHLGFLTIAAPYTFPSGNMARVTALVFAIYLHPARADSIGDNWAMMGIARIAAASILALAAWSHLAIGDHWPSDVLGGLLLGIAAAFGFGWILKVAAPRLR